MKLDEGVGVTGELDIETDTVDGVTVVEWLNGTAGVVVPEKQKKLISIL